MTDKNGDENNNLNDEKQNQKKENEKTDGEFKQEEETKKTDSTEFLGHKFGEYAPKTLVYILTGTFMTLGGVIGAILLAISIGGLFCMIEMLELVQNPTILAEQDDEVTSFLWSEFSGCTENRATSPIGILSGLLGLIMGAYPGYKLSMLVKNGFYIRSFL